MSIRIGVSPSRQEVIDLLESSGEAIKRSKAMAALSDDTNRLVVESRNRNVLNNVKPLIQGAFDGFYVTRSVISVYETVGDFCSSGPVANVNDQNIDRTRLISDREVILCKSHQIHKSDLQRIEEQLQVTQRSLEVAEAIKKEAEQEYNEAWARAVDHVVPSVSLIPPSVSAAVQSLGIYLTYSGPALDTARAVRSKAYDSYNWTLIKYSQEMAQLGHMQRAYNKQHKDDDSSDWGFFWDIETGAFGFLVRVFSQKF